MSPDISVIIPTHNRSDMLVEAIESCRRSATGLKLEIIVVDDASDEDISQAIAPLDVRYDRLHTSSGSSAARNRGLALATGRYVKFLDSDDVLIEGALQREYHTALDTDADIVVAGWIDTALDSTKREVLLEAHKPPTFSSIVDDLLAGRAVPTSAALYRGSLATRIAWDPVLSKLNDWDYFVSSALQAATISSIEGPSYRWRQHSGARITSSTSFVVNAREFYAILGKLEAALIASNQYTVPRQRRMAQYLYKELRGMYRFDRPRADAILKNLFALDPQFVPHDEERSRSLRCLFAVMPAGWVLSAYGLVRRAIDHAADAQSDKPPVHEHKGEQ